jgi:anti-sigma B factor antagonist
MDLVVRQEDLGGVPVVSFTGELDLTTVPQARDALVQVASLHPGETVVVDLDGVSFLDSVGLGVLVGGLRRVRGAGGDLVLVCTVPRLLDVLNLTRLDRVFEIFPAVGAVPAGAHRCG